MAVTAAAPAFPVDTIWYSITAQSKAPLPAPYIPPILRHTSSCLSHHSLQLCTESLGSETGSDSYSEDELDYFSSSSSSSDVEEEEEQKKELAEVNYHCSIRRRTSPAPPFPPPLTSISRADGSCISMRPHRRDGRLVVEAVSIPAKKYLHVERLGGRLILSFVSTTSSSSSSSPPPKQAIPEEEVEVEEQPPMEEEDEEVEEEEEEEEVEVVDRGTVVEVKLTPQPQPLGGAAAVKVHRSSLVINKFVSGTPPEPESEPARTTTAATAGEHQCGGGGTPEAGSSAAAEEEEDSKLLFASKSRSLAELLHQMRRCSQHRRPLFFWEPCGIATSS